MTDQATKNAVMEALLEATETVHILGAVAFDVDWEKVCDAWKLRNARPDVVVRGESDNTLFTRSFVSDSATAKERRTYKQMRVIREHMLELSDLLVRAGWDAKEIKESRRVEIIHIDSPLSVARIDDRYFTQLSVPGNNGAIEEVIEGDAHPTLRETWADLSGPSDHNANTFGP